MERGFNMPCYYPVGTQRTDGTKAYRPCGTCIGCRLQYSRDWAVRCMHEASLYKDSCFVTLTYNDENLPENGSLVKDELPKFIKRLRRHVEPLKIRFFGCGEYGEEFSRPHYHVCLFGYDPPDREAFKPRWVRYYKNRFKNGPDHTLYTSKVLSKLWRKGFHSIGELTFESAGYTARYVTKKVNGEKKSSWYEGRQEEFALMSRMPGLGKEWIEKYLTDVYPKDYFHINRTRFRPNRYYDEVLKKNLPEMYEEVKERRQEYADSRDPPSKDMLRGYHRERHRLSITKRLERKIENGKT